MITLRVGAGRRYVSTYPARPGVGRTGSRSRLSDAAAPTRLTRKGGITAGQRGGLDTADSSSLPKPGISREE